jgi:broad specificity phosphatase PhoE
MRLVLVRHPIAVANVQGKVHGSLEDDLDARGYGQVDQLKERLRSEEFGGFYSSDAYRCRVLMESLLAGRDACPAYSPLFREINNGVLGGKEKQEAQRIRLDNDEDFRPYGGESLRDLAERAREGLELIKSGKHERSLLVSHGWFLKAFLGLQLGMSVMDSINALKFSNCAISEIRLEGDKCSIEYLNNRDFLTIR